MTYRNILVNGAGAVKTLATIAILAGIAAAGVKNVAVVETEIDIHSGAAADLSPADVRLVTGELRREALRNLPRDRYNVMTSETVYAQGSAVLEECANENCVIALGSKIGADFIVRGTISKIQTLLALSVEIYETEDGNLVASSDLVRSGNIGELLDKAASACAGMYKQFAEAQNTTAVPAPKIEPEPTPPATYTVTATVNPAKGGYVVREPNKETYDAGEPITLTAIAYNGYSFTGWWAGAATGTAMDTTANSVKITADGNRKMVAHFRRVPKYTGTKTTFAETTLEARDAWANTATQNMIRRKREGEGKGEKIHEVRNWYFAPRYVVPGADMTPRYGAANLEIGKVWGEGTFVGVDLMGGGYTNNNEHNFTDWAFGVSISMGNIYGLWADLQLVYGGTVGITSKGIGGAVVDYYSERVYWHTGFIGPYIGLRWRFIELSYRGSLGYAEKWNGLVPEYVVGDEIRHYSYYYDGSDYNSQLMLGLYLSAAKKAKPIATIYRSYMRRDSASADLETSKRKHKNGFSVGMGSSVYDHIDKEYFQFGFVHSRPVTEKMLSLNFEGDCRIDGHGSNSIIVPVTVLFQLNVFSVEAGLHGEIPLSEEALFDAGIVAGFGYGAGKNHARRYFYRYSSGINYPATHVFGISWLF